MMTSLNIAPIITKLGSGSCKNDASRLDKQDALVTIRNISEAQDITSLTR